LPIQESPYQSIEIIPVRVRWLAIAAGLLSGLGGSLLFGPLFLLVPSVQILGAVIQPYSPRPGRLLLSMGVLLLSGYAGLFLAPQAFGAILGSRSEFDLSHVALFVLLLVALLSVAWCDVAFIKAIRQIRQSPSIGAQRFPGPGDWIVWITAICISVWILPMSLQSAFVYRRTGRLDILLSSTAFGLVVLLFDAALVVNAVRLSRSHESRRGIG
jgi:hypothetical protein